MAIDAEAVLAAVRVAKALTPSLPAESVRGRDPACVGCPSHLLPGRKVHDPVTGLEGEVIAYGRAIVPGPLP